MVRCPECGTENPSPTRTWSVLDEPTKTGSFNKSNVGIFHCVKCGVMFPNVIGSKRFAIVDADEYNKVVNEIKYLKLENEKLREDVDLVNLKTTLTALETEVSRLRKEKGELEKNLAQLNDSLE